MIVKSLAATASLLVSIIVNAEGGKRFAIVLDPGHSHASAVFAEATPELSDEIHLYAAPGPGEKAFINSISHFNSRPEKPTRWVVRPYVGADFEQRMLHEPAGNVVILSGQNDKKIHEVLSSLGSGQNVLADKPVIIDHANFPLLEEALNTAGNKHLVLYDGMTERFNIAYRIQREIMRDREVFGVPLTGSAAAPAVTLKNLHSLVKYDRGEINLRPAWFFDIRKQGEGIADVGTHLIDLEMWTLFPDQAIDYRRDIRLLKATRAPLDLSRTQFERITGEKAWPSFLQNNIRNDRLEYFCNNTAQFTLRGIHTEISDSWEYESVGALNDSYLVEYRGSLATIRVRQSKAENYIAEIDVIPNEDEHAGAIREALEKRLQHLAIDFPNLSLQQRQGSIRVVIPREDRTRGGSTFAQLVHRFLEYSEKPATLPSWEKSNMLAKYYLTTEAVELARKSP